MDLALHRGNVLVLAGVVISWGDLHSLEEETEHGEMDRGRMGGQPPVCKVNI